MCSGDVVMMGLLPRCGISCPFKRCGFADVLVFSELSSRLWRRYQIRVEVRLLPSSRRRSLNLFLKKFLLDSPNGLRWLRRKVR